MDSAGIVPKSRKIPLLLTREQKKTLRFWAAGKRAAYNETLKHLQGHRGKSPHWKTLKPKILRQMPNCYKSVPYQVKGDAVREAWQAVRNAKLKAKQSGEKQELRYQSRRMPTQSLFIPASAIRENGIYPQVLGTLEYAESLPAPIAEKREKGEPKPVDEIRDSRLLCEEVDAISVSPSTKQNKHRLLVRCESSHSTPVYVIFSPIFQRQDLVGLDIKLSIESNDSVYTLTVCFPVLRPAPSDEKANDAPCRESDPQTYKNLVKELHCKLVHFLVSNFDVILLPSFDTSQMVPRGNRRIRKKSVRQMLTLSHYKFKQRLLDKAEQHGKHVIIVNEAYTSKTISWTGEVKKNLGGSKIITATDGTSMHRDLNGARGILVRFLTWIHALLDEACPA